MPAWLDKQRADQRRKSRDRRTAVGAGLAGAAGYEGYALTRRPSWSVSRNARVATTSARRSRALAPAGRQRLADAASMTIPPRHSAERRAWEKGRGLVENPPAARWRHNFDPKRFTQGGTGMRSQAYAQQVGLGSVRANFGLSRRAAERVMGVGSPGQKGPFAYVPKTGKPPTKGTPAYNAWQQAASADAAQRVKNAQMRANMVRTAEARQRKANVTRGTNLQSASLRTARGRVSREGTSMLNRSRSLEATSRYAAKQGFKGGARMGLAFAGASGTTAAGLAGMRAWQKRNQRKASAVPKPSWDTMSDEERKAAVPRALGGWQNNRGARPVGAIGTPGRKGKFA